MDQQQSTAYENAKFESTPRERPVHDPVWNFETVCFKVENQLFTVIKKDLLVPGSTFVDMFNVPSGPQPAEGKDADDPIILDGVIASHFSAFLSVLYPWASGSVPLQKQDQDTLLGVLHLANMWHFLHMRNSVITLLSTDSVLKRREGPEKVRLGQEYRVKDWALMGYIDILQTKGLQFGDLEKDPYNFDQMMAMKLLYLQARYALLPHTCSDCDYTCKGSLRGKNLEKVVEEFLHDEIAAAVYVPN